ncbi:MAG: LuxR C-terminal-related transcriptional regulator [Candidatus Nanopelagicales bacterium]
MAEGARAPGDLPGADRLDRLVGRDHELDLLLGLVQRPDHRLVTVTGPSGVGKTRLAAEALQRLAWVAQVKVPLAAVRDATLMPDAIVASIQDGPGAAGGPAEALWQRYSGDEVVLLLDNVEQIPGAADVVLALLDDYPKATVLATSVRPLSAAGEYALPLRPLPVPDPDAILHDGTHPALTMFLQRASAADATIVPDDDWVAGAAEVCRAVGGLPLAIELAAARSASIPPALMASQLARTGGLGLLRGGAPGAPDRHSSLSATLEWTTQFLSPPAAELFTAMAVFEGPAAPDALSWLVPPGTEALDPLSELVDLHLVEMDVSDPEEPLFWLLPPIRAFAADRLAAEGGTDTALERHDSYVRVRAQTGAGWAPYEVADLLGAFDRARLAGQVDSTLELALLASRGALPPGADAWVASRLEDLLQGPGDDPVLEARALVWSVTHGPATAPDRAAFAAWTQERVQRAISTARASGDPAALLDALELTVRTVMVTLDRDLGLSGIQEGLALAERTGDVGRLARFRMWAGMAAESQGYSDPAEAMLLQAWSAGTHAGDRVAAEYAAMFLHVMAVEQGRPIDAPLPQLTDLLASAWRHNDPFEAATLLSLLAADATRAGDIGSAARYASQMLPIAEDRLRVDPLATARILTTAVRTLVAAGRFEDAARIERSLAELEPVLRGAMSAGGYASYAQAVSDLTDGGHREAVGGEPVRSLLESLRLAEHTLRSLIAQTAPPRPPQVRLSTAPSPAGEASLTPRERDVLVLLARGTSNGDIADRLGISTKTVMHHTVAIYRKLGVRGRAEAAAWAVRAGLAGE